MNISKISVKGLKRMALLMLLTMLIQIFTPSVSYALTSGPSQPEFSSFEPVATTNMVDPFSGDFTYNVPVLNVPGPNGSGYALSLSYHSGENMETEASWVGYGWTLNPGAINRNKRGFADDWSGEQVTYHSKTKANRTVSTGAGLAGQLFSFTTPGLNGQIRFNNYNGMGYTVGINQGVLDGVATLGYSITDGDGSFSLRVNPGAILSKIVKRKKEKAEDKNWETMTTGELSDAKIINYVFRHFDIEEKSAKANYLSAKFGSFGVFNTNTMSYPVSLSKYNGGFGNFSISFTVDPCTQTGGQASFSGSFGIQKNVPVTTSSVYGFMHTHHADQSEDATNQMDFYVDKEVDYTKKNRFIGMPVANADVFTMSGEGVSGGFKPQYQEMLHFRPEKVVSNSVQSGFNVDVHYTLPTGGGVGFGGGGGYQRLTKGPWKDINITQAKSVGFRFTNDLGGEISYAQGKTRQKVSLQQDNGVPGLKKYSPNYSSVNQAYTGTKRKSSAFLGFNTIAGVNAQEPGTTIYAPVHPYAYEKSLHSTATNSGLSGFIDYNEPSMQKLLSEFSVTKENGQTYNYGLGVYARNERTLSTSVINARNPADVNGQIYQDSYEQDGTPSDDKLHTILGQEENSAYATSYLLTSILSTDYVDRNNDGPTDDDFGGWTKFNYEQVHGSPNKNDANTDWYKWRVPYNGFNYQRNELSRIGDDLATQTEGEKEIYFVKSIETKTHIAVFETSNREDGLEAADYIFNVDGNSQAKGTNRLKKLDRVFLYLKSEYLNNPLTAKPLQVVNFKYAYELCQGVPNHTQSGSSNPNGKLTLKKMWIDYEGVYDAKVSPYEFHYEYPAPTLYPAKYQSGVDDVTGGINTNSENPSYNYFNTDAWGNYQINGAAKFDNMVTWLDQTKTEADFDPAAWQLKRIVLPSGGEIHVQYEQDQYRYVQDERASAMVSLSSSFDKVTNNNFFVINHQDLGIDAADIAAYETYLDGYFKNRHIYFKFLYNITDGDEPLINHCDAEYISGYAKVHDVSLNGTNGIKFSLGSTNNLNRNDTPKEMCVDFWQHTRRGVTLSRACDFQNNLGIFSGSGGNSIDDVLEDVIDEATNLVASTVPVRFMQCENMNDELSYLRLPVFKSKRGGGIRVKRLMMFDDGVSLSSESELYGSEYVYEDANGNSFGVATNEPNQIREENALIQFETPATLSGFDELKEKLIGGRDRYQYEGAIGEGFLPGASVGYSTVLVKNIHSGKTNTGFTIHDFYTAKDYPFKAKNTVIESEKDYLPLPLPYYSSYTNNLWQSQGYQISMFNMHGKSRKVSTYSGKYSNPAVLSTKGQEFDPTTRTLVSSSETFYFQPNEQVPVMDDLENVRMVNMGEETEIYDYHKRVHDKLYSGNLSVDVTYCAPVLAFAGFYPSVSISETDLYNHVTVKSTNHPVIVKGTRTLTDGIYHTSENLAFDPNNGRPLVTKSYDGYNDFTYQTPVDLVLDATNNVNHKGTYVNQSLPAWWYYGNMNQKSSNQLLTLTFPIAGSASGTSANYLISGNQSQIDFVANDAAAEAGFCSLLSNFSTGDLLRISNFGSGSGYFHLAAINGATFELQSVYYNQYAPGGLDNIKTIQIVRSGRTNQTSVDVGSFTTYGADLVNDVSHTIITTPPITTDIDNFINNLNAASVSGGPVSFPSGLLADPTGIDDCLSTVNSISLSPFSYGNSVGLNINIAYVNNDKACNSSVKGSSATNEFFADYETGEIYYGDPSGCYNQLVGCLAFCQTANANQTVEKVVAASAMTLSDDWYYAEASYNRESYGVNSRNDNDFELAKRGKWRLSSMFGFKASISSGILSAVDVDAEMINDERATYNAGTYTLDLFRFKNPNSNDAKKWLKSSTIKKYSPNGNALEEENILGIKSVAKYGYNKSLPYLLANNSNYESVMFESFENAYGPNYEFIEDGIYLPLDIDIDSYNAHSGKASLKVDGIADFFTTNQVRVNNQIAENGMLFKTWIKGLPRLSNQVDEPNLNIEINSSGSGSLHNFKWVAQTGEWTLYEVFISPVDLVPLLNQYVSFTFNHTGSTTIYADDVKMQPNDAEMTTYVYDVKSLRLLTTFDSEHFGMFYQYDLEGKLVRKIIETEKGLKTISETQYNTIKKDRSGL